MVDGINNADKVEVLGLVGGGDAVVAVGGGFSFIAALRGAVLEGILSVNLEAGEFRRGVGDGVVKARPAVSGHELLADRVAPARGEGRCLTKEAESAVGACELAHAAEGDRAEGARKIELRFTIKELAGRGECTRVAGEAVLKDEADLEAVAEVFRSFETEARAAVLAGLHLEGVVGISGCVAIGVLIAEAVVDKAVKRHISCDGRTGKSAENCERSKGLLHVEYSKFASLPAREFLAGSTR